MNNYELMRFLSQISKNKSNKDQVIFLGTLTLLGLTAWGIMYTKYIQSLRRYKQLELQDEWNQKELIRQHVKIRTQENTIKQLISDNKTKTPASTPLLIH